MAHLPGHWGLLGCFSFLILLVLINTTSASNRKFLPFKHKPQRRQDYSDLRRVMGKRSATWLAMADHMQLQTGIKSRGMHDHPIDDVNSKVEDDLEAGLATLSHQPPLPFHRDYEKMRQTPRKTTHPISPRGVLPIAVEKAEKQEDEKVGATRSSGMVSAVLLPHTYKFIVLEKIMRKPHMLTRSYSWHRIRKAGEGRPFKLASKKAASNSAEAKAGPERGNMAESN